VPDAFAATVTVRVTVVVDDVPETVGPGWTSPVAKAVPAAMTAATTAPSYDIHAERTAGSLRCWLRSVTQRT
jgi:hypothetical protein